MGLRVEEIAPSGDETPIGVVSAGGTRFEARAWAEVVVLEGAEALAILPMASTRAGPP